MASITTTSWWKRAYTVDLAASKSLPTDSTKDISQHPYFLGGLSRAVWRYWFLRLTRSGRWFAFVTFLLVFNGAMTLEIQAYIPALYAAALWAVAEGTVYLTKPRYRLHIRHGNRVAAGEILQIEAEVANLGKLTGYDWNLLPTKLPLALDAVAPQGTPLGTMVSGEIRRVRLGVRCPKRGEYLLRGYRVETDFPFGLMNSYTPYWEDHKILVRPAIAPLRRIEIPTGQKYHPGGVALAGRHGDSMELLGNREYRAGDRLRDIDWRTTARMAGSPIVREWREEFFQRVALVLDTHVPTNLRGKVKTEHEAAFERAVSITATIAHHLATGEYIVDAFAAGPDVYPVSVGNSFEDEILDILAMVTTSGSDPLSVIEPQIQAIQETLTTIICIFLKYESRQQDFVQNLRQSGIGVKVIVTPPRGVLEPVSEHYLSVISADTFEGGVEFL